MPLPLTCNWSRQEHATVPVRTIGGTELVKITNPVARTIVPRVGGAAVPNSRTTHTNLSWTRLTMWGR